MLNKIASLTLSALFFFAQNAVACDDRAIDGPRVALVLSGGGALTATHIGALKVIEEMDVPIHCVVGTSMGAVIGGLYASGYSATEIEEIFTTHNWGEIIRGETPRRNKPFVQKEREAEYLSGYLAGISDGKINLPSSVRSMRGLRIFFRYLTRHVELDKDFDELAVPFRAIAMNLDDGEIKALAKGDLVEAMLASMAVPGGFAPREIDGIQYADGGMVSQLPVRAAKEMGADIVIALDSTVKPPKLPKNPAAPTVARQLIRIVVYQNFEQDIAHLDDQDLLIRPNLEGLDTVAFELAEKGITLGEAEAKEHLSRLAEIKKIAAPKTYNAAIRESKPLPEENTQLAVSNPTLIDDEIVKSRFFHNVDPNIVNDYGAIQLRAHDLSSFGGFEEVDLARSNSGIVLSTKERPLGNQLLQTGLRFSNNFNGDSNFSILARYSKRPINSKGGEFAISAELGTDIGLTFEGYYPFGARSRYFFQPAAFYRGREFNLKLGDQRLADIWAEAYAAQARIGRELGTWGIIAVDFTVQHNELETKLSADGELSKFDTALGGVGAFFAVDTLNHIDWPTEGGRFTLRGQELFYLEDTDASATRFEISALKAFSYNELNLVLSGSHLAITPEEDDFIDIYRYGGFRRLTAFPSNSLPSEEISYGSAELFKRLGKTNTMASLPLYVGALVEVGDISFDLIIPDTQETLYSGGVYIGLETPVGPLFLGGAVGSDDAKSAFISLGRSF